MYYTQNFDQVRISDQTNQLSICPQKKNNQLVIHSYDIRCSHGEDVMFLPFC